MYLKNAISVSLAITAILSIFMLQMGSDSETSVILPILAMPIIASGVWLVDVRKKFVLSEGWSNVLILIAVGLHAGRLIQSPSEFLAYSIANILVWVQIILFFRKKDVLTSYHILTLAFVQGGVACVFQQSALFAPLLLVFSFAVLCSVSLLFLNQERFYYTSHAFLKPAFGAGEKVKRVTVGDLLLLAVKTVIVTPLMILLGYQWKEWLEKDAADTKRLKVHGARESAKDEEGTSSGLFSFWESAEGLVPDGHWPGQKEGDASRLEKEVPAVAVWTQAAGSESGTGTNLRWPLLRMAPLFSGFRTTDTRLRIGGALLTRLFFGAALSLMVGGLVFFSFPRLSEMEIGSVQFGHDQWRGAPPAIRSVTGFSEQMKLGEMGPSVDNHESVLRVRLSDILNAGEPVLTEGSPLYLRGTVLVRYEDREWFAPSAGLEPVRTFHSRLAPGFPESERKSLLRQMKQPGEIFSSRADGLNGAIFASGNKIVSEELVLYPMSTPIIFSVWPFFQVDRGIGMVTQGRFLRSDRHSTGEMYFTLFSNAFDSAGQSALTPVQENPKRILAESLTMDSDRLPKLIAAAQEWDRQSGLASSDTIGRARAIEERLRDFGEFHYSRRGVNRDPSIDPLEDFVSKNREGHCEYFAGALAMALRAIGIPSRVVVGFCPVYAPESDGFSVVRQSDAHTWVEAYIGPEHLPPDTFDPESEVESFWWSDGGWLRLDATPERSEELIRSFSIGLSSWREFFGRWWNDYVLNYSGGRQRQAIYEPAKQAFLWGWGHLTGVVSRLNPFDSAADRAKRLAASESQDRFAWGELGRNLAALAILFSVGFGVFWAVRRLIRRQIGSANESRKAEQIVSFFFQRLERCLARYGAVRSFGQTPREYLDLFLAGEAASQLRVAWADSAGTPGPDAVLAEVIDVYYRVRFGSGSVTADERDRFEAFFRMTENLPKKG